MLELEVSRQLGKEDGCKEGEQGQAGPCGGGWNHASPPAPLRVWVTCREAKHPLGQGMGDAEE